MRIETCLTVDDDSSQLKASQILAQHTQLSQATIKEAMQKGAVWLVRGDDKQRLRRATKALRVGDQLELNYDADLLSSIVPEPKLLHDAQHYSIWFKPFGLSCQGSRWGDFASINRWVELNLSKHISGAQRPVFLVHRLDRATTGLMVLCHSKAAARLFSDLFAKGSIDKRYQAIVHGDFSVIAPGHRLDLPVGDKPASSVFSHVCDKDDYSLVGIQLLTGRKHQIRQHLVSLGFPIVGDRLYGEASSEDPNLQLQAISLRFICPISDVEQFFEVDERLRLQL